MKEKEKILNKLIVLCIVIAVIIMASVAVAGFDLSLLTDPEIPITPFIPGTP